MFMVLEAMEGGTLKKAVIKQMTSGSHPHYGAGEALKWAINVASAMAYLHSTCKPMIIHR